MSEKLDEQGLQFARDAVKSAAAYNPMGDISTVADVAIRAYLQTAAADVSGLVEQPCTCHPDDNPPSPCAEKYAFSACLAASTLQTLSDAVAEREAEPVAWLHPDDLAVDRFAAAMKAKLAKKRGEGRGGWNDPDQCSVDHLSYLLIQHVWKGDPLDVGNLAMMLHQRGERIVIDDEARGVMSSATSELEALRRDRDESARAWRKYGDDMHQRAMTAEARVAELEKALERYYDVTKGYFSDSDYDANGNLAESAADVSVLLVAASRVREGGKVE